MSGRDDNHELTRVSLREEVENTLDELTGVPAEQKRSVTARLEQVVERYSSPFPDANFLGRIDELAPGYAVKILDASLTSLEHRQRIEIGAQDIQNKQLDLVHDMADGEFGSTKQGRWLGFSAYISCLVFASVMAYLGYEVLAIGGFLTSAAGVVTQIIRGEKSGVSVSAETEAVPVQKTDASRPQLQQRNRPGKKRRGG